MAKKFNIDRYKKTRPGQPRGNPDLWRKIAERLLLGKDNQSTDLQSLGLQALPDEAGLKRAYRVAMLAAHPDRAGGSHEVAAKITGAYERLVETLARMAPKKSQPPSIVTTIILPGVSAEIPDDLENGDYAGEIKRDGCRYGLYIGADPYQKGHRNTLLSSHESTVDVGQFVDKTLHLSHVTKQNFGHAGTILDGEVFLKDLTVTQTILSSGPDEALRLQEKERLGFHAFDIPFLRGVDLRQKPYDERRIILAHTIAELAHPEILLMPQVTKDLLAFFYAMTAQGHEGVVLKHRRGTYGVGWHKLKKSYDVSCVITGFVPGKDGLKGMVGSLKLSVFQGGKLVEIGRASGFDNLTREAISRDPEAYRGRVVDVFAQEMTSAGRLRHATWHRPRLDLVAEDCTLDKVRADLKGIPKFIRVKG